MPSFPRVLVPVVLFPMACAPSRDAVDGMRGRDTLVVFSAASLAVPMRALLDTVSRESGAVVQEEHGGSLELARRVTELHRVPDVIALADEEVFPRVLVPSATSWYATFARNRMVIAWTARSRYASELDASTWFRILLRPDVLVGRTDPELAPAGYRALLMYALAEQYYREPGLAARLVRASPARLQRGNAAELAALLEAGELDYIIEYESLAQAHHFAMLRLPPEIDLGDASLASAYAVAAVRVRRGQDSVTLRGTPIRYALSVPRAAPHAAAGARFVTTLLGARGKATFRGANVDMLDRPVLIGDSVPHAVRDALPH